MLGTSANSVDINASPNNNPSAYNMNLTITNALTLLLTDSLIISIYVNRVGSGDPITVRTYFEGNYYSFTQSTLNAGTTLLSSNNTWTGTNTYSLGITAPSIDNTGNLIVGNTTNKLTLKGNTIEVNGDVKNIDNGYPTLTDKSFTLKNYVISVAVIPGTIIIWPSITGPPNNQYNNGVIKAYLYCDGTAYVKNTYPDLSNAIAIDFPHGSDLTQFKVPDLREKFIVGATNSGSRTYLGQPIGGATGVRLNANHIPAHSHVYSANTRGVTNGSANALSTFVANDTGNVDGTTSNYGNGNVDVPTIPPYAAIFYFIKT